MITLSNMCFYLDKRLKLICTIKDGVDPVKTEGELVAIDLEGFNGVNPLKVKYYGSSKEIPMYACFSLQDVVPVLCSGNDFFGLIKKGLAVNKKDYEKNV